MVLNSLPWQDKVEFDVSALITVHALPRQFIHIISSRKELYYHKVIENPARRKKAGSISHVRITNCTNREKRRATCERNVEGGRCDSVSFWKERIKAQLLNTQLHFALVYRGQDRPRQSWCELWIIRNIDIVRAPGRDADLSGNSYSFASSAAWLDWAAVLSNFL